jgi:poly(hydroxyalkanoate) granule-associated protein
MEKKPHESLFDSELAQSVKASAQQIWLAGMGAFAKAQQEGGKVFEALVKEGASLQRRTQEVAEERLGDVTSRMSAMADDVSARAGQQLGRLESMFEERVAKAMRKWGVPVRKDIDALAERIDALSAQVARLQKAAKARKPATKAGGDVKPAAKRAARKTTAKRTLP